MGLQEQTPPLEKAKLIKNQKQQMERKKEKKKETKSANCQLLGRKIAKRDKVKHYNIRAHLMSNLESICKSPNSV